MAIQIVMDNSGDSHFEFDPADHAALAEAMWRFKHLTKLGYTAAERTRSGISRKVTTFDPTATEVAIHTAAGRRLNETRRGTHPQNRRVTEMAADSTQMRPCDCDVCGSIHTVGAVRTYPPLDAETKSRILLRKWLSRNSSHNTRRGAPSKLSAPRPAGATASKKDDS